MRFILSVILSLGVLLSCTGTLPKTLVSNSIESLDTKPDSPADQPVDESYGIVVRIPMEKKAIVSFADGTIDEYTLSEYTDEWLLSVQTRFSASALVLDRTEYSYDGKLLVAKTLKDGEGKTVSRRVYTYTDEGYLASEVLYDGKDKVVSTSEYGYDDNGNRILWVLKDSKAIKIAETQYLYAEDRATGAVMYDGGGKKTGSIRYEYDDQGRIKSRTYLNASGSVQRKEIDYWENDLLVREELTSPGAQVQQRISYEYGSNAELLSKLIEDMAGKSRQSITYEYDFREELQTISE